MILHLFLEIGAKGKNILRLNHLLIFVISLFFSQFQEAQAMTRGESSPFMTSSPRKTKLPPPRHPLENRNSAPDIVVTGTTGLTQFRHSSLGNCPTSGPAINPTGSRRQQHPLEDRIHRAKARVQNGLYNLSSTSQSSSASSIYSTNRYLNFKFDLIIFYLACNFRPAVIWLHRVVQWNPIKGWASWNLSCLEFKFDDSRLS